MKTDTQGARLKELAQKLGLQLRDVESTGLEGLWEDVKVTDRDIADAKKAAFGTR